MKTFKHEYTQHMKTIKLIGIALLFMVLKTTLSWADDVKPDSLEIGIVEHLNEFVPNNILLVNEKKDTVDLKKLINKPTVLCFVYFECPMLCSPLMSGLEICSGCFVVAAVSKSLRTGLFYYRRARQYFDS